MDKNTRITKGVALALGTALVSGVSIFLNSYAVQGFDSDVFTFAKNALVAAALAALVLGFSERKKLLELSKQQWAQLAGIGLLGGAIPFVLFFRGLQAAGGATASFIHKMLFLTVAVAAFVVLKERPRPLLLVGVAALLAANFIIIKPDFSLQAAHLLVGAAVLFWTAEQVWAKKLVASTSGKIVALGRMGFGSLFLLAYLVFSGKAPVIFSMNGAQYAWIFLTGALLLLYVWTYYTSLEYLDVSVAASLLSLGAPITLGLSYAFKGTILTPSSVAGVALTLAGAALVAWSVYRSHDLAQRAQTARTSARASEEGSGRY